MSSDVANEIGQGLIRALAMPFVFVVAYNFAVKFLSND